MKSIAQKRILLYGAAFAVLLIILKTIEYRFLVKSFTIDIYMGAIALVFTVLGIWLSKKISPENKSFLQISNRVEGDASGILSERELEVLKHIADGKSNQEIAASLYISIHTVKTHTTNIFEKLQVRRRTQAVLRARELGLIKELITGTNLKK